MRTPYRRTTAWLAGALAVCAALVAAACSSSDAAPAPAGGVTTPPVDDASIDRATTTDGGATGSDAAEAGMVTCPVPALGGQTVNAHIVHASPPADMGGALTAGTYDLTDLEIYVEQSGDDPDGGSSATTSDTARATIVIEAGMIGVSNTASPPGGGSPIVTMFTGKQHVDDIFLVTEQTCPGTDVRQTPFTASGATLTLHSAQLRREIYTRRP
ncbi:MAG: hypothetical protein JWP87_790 [Labilithrix sp.]|nr:hypothetical protein [Labilithrix sp.]